MADRKLLLRRLRAEGYAAESVTTASGGVVAMAGLAHLSGGGEVFAKTLRTPVAGLFEVEAEGLKALRDEGGAATPDIMTVTDDLLVLSAMRPAGEGEGYWEQLGRMLVTVHTSAVSDRFGWHRDGWLGRMRQENGWNQDGYAFFAEHRILRWLAEPEVEAAFDREERRALERLAAALPELIPPAPAVLTHGDLWSGNVLAGRTGEPVLIDPAVSYTWAEVDLSMLWCSLRPPAAERFFTAYAETAALREGWQDRMPLLFLRELLSIVAHDDDDWGAADAVRKLIAPYRSRSRGVSGPQGVPSARPSHRFAARSTAAPARDTTHPTADGTPQQTETESP